MKVMLRPVRGESPCLQGHQNLFTLTLAPPPPTETPPPAPPADAPPLTEAPPLPTETPPPTEAPPVLTEAPPPPETPPPPTETPPPAETGPLPATPTTVMSVATSVPNDVRLPDTLRRSRRPIAPNADRSPLTFVCGVTTMGFTRPFETSRAALEVLAATTPSRKTAGRGLPSGFPHGGVWQATEVGAPGPRDTRGLEESPEGAGGVAGRIAGDACGGAAGCVGARVTGATAGCPNRSIAERRGRRAARRPAVPSELTVMDWVEILAAAGWPFRCDAPAASAPYVLVGSEAGRR